MFEKDEDYKKARKESKVGITKVIKAWSAREEVIHDEGFRKGAEFGYNKANKWNTETPSDAVGNKDLLLHVAKYDFDVGYYHFENKRFYTNDGKEVTPLAWKEIHYLQENE